MTTGQPDTGKLTESARIGEPGAVRQLVLQMGLTIAALIVPSSIALVERPDNTTEGLVAMSLGVALLAWLSYRMATSGFRVEDGALTTLGLRPRRFPLTALRFETWTVPHRGTRLHRLVADGDGATTRLTRPLDDQARATLETRLGVGPERDRR